uniref:EIF-4F 25 kDa subunit n=1 Tax=Trichuris muris TaxID=70415 RepID=A0A5S6QMI5_TRIMR
MSSEDEQLHWSLFSSDGDRDDDWDELEVAEGEIFDEVSITASTSSTVSDTSSSNVHPVALLNLSLSSDEENEEEDEEDYPALSHAWAWWYHKPSGRSRISWRDNLYMITLIDDAVMFWHFYHNLKRPSELPFGSDYFIFKAHLTPNWETPENARGGKVLLSFCRSSAGADHDVNNCWLRFLVSLLSGQMESVCSYVNGIFVSVRTKCYKVGLWLHSDSTESQKRELLRITNELGDPGHPAFYKSHVKALR